MLQRLRVSANGRHLVKENGEPFLWLGDTAWELFHALDREEAEYYLRTRAEQGFTVVQAVALAENDGLRKGNAYGKTPLLTNDRGEFDPALPDVEPGVYGYWEHVDYVVDKAAEYGLYVAFLPTWGDKINHAWGFGPEIFKPDNAAAFGEWLGRRYADRANIVWVLGGDRAMSNRRHFDVVGNMARAIRRADGGAHLITFHPNGEYSSSFYWHEEDWLDFNMLQSSHYRHHHPNDEMIERDYARSPAKPVLDAEPCYEDHPISFKAENGLFDAKDVRLAAYWALFAGAFGHTYGHHSVWQMAKEPTEYFLMPWRVVRSADGALDRSGLGGERRG